MYLDIEKYSKPGSGNTRYLSGRYKVAKNKTGKATFAEQFIQDGQKNRFLLCTKRKLWHVGERGKL